MFNPVHKSFTMIGHKAPSDTSTEGDQLADAGSPSPNAKCQFAHGLSELKINTIQHNMYKTKMCFTFERRAF